MTNEKSLTDRCNPEIKKFHFSRTETELDFLRQLQNYLNIKFFPSQKDTIDRIASEELVDCVEKGCHKIRLENILSFSEFFYDHLHKDFVPMALEKTTLAKVYERMADPHTFGEWKAAEISSKKILNPNYRIPNSFAAALLRTAGCWPERFIYEKIYEDSFIFYSPGYEENIDIVKRFQKLTRIKPVEVIMPNKLINLFESIKKVVRGNVADNLRQIYGSRLN